MKYTNLLRSSVLALALAAGTTAFAQINFNIVVAPPAPLNEVAPPLAPGQTWAPGYWALNNGQHVWVRGRTMVQREGYLWVPDRWVQQGGTYVRQPGRWERSLEAKPPKYKKVKKLKHDNGRRDHGKSGKGN